MSMELHVCSVLCTAASLVTMLCYSLVFTSTRSSSLRISPVIGSFESLFLETRETAGKENVSV